MEGVHHDPRAVQRGLAQVQPQRRQQRRVRRASQRRRHTRQQESGRAGTTCRLDWPSGRHESWPAGSIAAVRARISASTRCRDRRTLAQVPANGPEIGATGQLNRLGFLRRVTAKRSRRRRLPTSTPSHTAHVNTVPVQRSESGTNLADTGDLVAIPPGGVIKPCPPLQHETKRSRSAIIAYILEKIQPYQ